MKIGSAVEEVFEAVPAVLLGAGAIVLAPLLFTGARPLAKSLVKGGLFVADKTRDFVSEAGERLGDVVAEARAEMVQTPTHEERPNTPSGNGQEADSSLH